MDSRKKTLDYNVLDGAKIRIEWVFNTFDKICVSFSGGKDSTVMFHLVAQHARSVNRKIAVLFVDWEAQFSHTISHVERMKKEYDDIIDTFYWVALPLRTTNAVSSYQPEWTCWQPGVVWVRLPPQDAITTSDYFPFFRENMSFEEFMPAFSEWFSQEQMAAIFIGIRADESLNRFLSIANRRKQRFTSDKPWTSLASIRTCNIYPLYDWKVADIWAWFSRTNSACNPLYNLMFQAGVPLRKMRVCEPFGLEQRQGLWLYHALEPERWARLCYRVNGSNSGKIYANTRGDFYSLRQLTLPVNHGSWRSYALYLLDSMPKPTAEHYRNKISIYLRWYQKHGFPDDIPDQQEKDLGSVDVPSWRRICKVLLRNDYWCRALSFSPNKATHYHRYSKRIMEKRLTWKLL